LCISPSPSTWITTVRTISGMPQAQSADQFAGITRKVVRASAIVIGIPPDMVPTIPERISDQLFPKGSGCNQAWLLKNSFRRVSGENWRARKPYKGRSRNWDTFTLIRNHQLRSFSTTTGVVASNPGRVARPQSSGRSLLVLRLGLANRSVSNVPPQHIDE